MLSVIIITKNEEKNIEECLKSIKKIANEIILVDSYSTDNTVSIGSKYTNNIFYKKLNNNYSNLRNYALSKTSYKWVLSLDADETLSQSLIRKLQGLIESSIYKGYLIPRRNYISKKNWLRHGLFYPDYQLRLFEKKNVGYINRVHETPNIGSRQLKKISPYLIHNPSRTKYDSFFSIKRLFSKDHNHILIQAEDLVKQKRSSLYYLLNSFYLFFKYFWDGFIRGKGFLDGWNGFRAQIIFSLIPLLVAVYAILLRYKIIKKYE